MGAFTTIFDARCDLGIVATWLHVSKVALDSVLSRSNWTPAAIETALKEKGIEAGYAAELAYASPDWNGALARLSEISVCDLDKNFVSANSPMRMVVEAITGADALLKWSDGEFSAVPLQQPWKSIELGFGIVATADDVRTLLPSLQNLRERAACAAFAQINGGRWPAWLSSRKRALQIWTQDDYCWNAWVTTLDALDAVAASQADYLGFEMG